MIIPVILGGGFGRRLYPLSTKDKPKQFLEILEPDMECQKAQSSVPRTIGAPKISPLQNTLARVHRPDIFGRAILVGARHHYDLIQQTMTGYRGDVLLEDAARNTGPAVMFALIHILKHVVRADPRTYFENYSGQYCGQDITMLIVPSDHIIDHRDLFYQDVTQAKAAANCGHIVTFGIRPHRVEPGYGHILARHIFPVPNDYTAQDMRNLPSNPPFARVERFIEKPNERRARQLTQNPDIYWNSGIFMANANMLAREFQTYCPDLWEICTQIMDRSVVIPPSRNVDSARSLFRALPDYGDLDAVLPSIPFDKAVMEKSKKISMLPARFGWRDIGSWDEMANIVPAVKQFR